MFGDGNDVVSIANPSGSSDFKFSLVSIIGQPCMMVILTPFDSFRTSGCGTAVQLITAVPAIRSKHSFTVLVIDLVEVTFHASSCTFRIALLQG
jgi:hypothetical protein